jgi:hypothetical protein
MPNQLEILKLKLLSFAFDLGPQAFGIRLTPKA